MLTHHLKKIGGMPHLKYFRFQKPDVFFEDGDTKIFPNGTMISQDGSQVEANVFWGALDSK